MKKCLVAILFISIVNTVSAQVAYFIKPSAPLDGSETVDDSVFISQPDIIRVDEVPAGGSQIMYYRNQTKKTANVREQIGDSAGTFASFSFTLTTNSAMNNITVAAVAIIGDTVPAAGSINATAAAIRDSINAFTSVPNYSATASGAIVTITPATDNTAAPNGRVVIVSSAGTVTPTNGILEGGFFRRNISTIYGAQNRLISVTEQGNSNSLLINADRVSEMTGDNPTTVWYNGVTNQNVTLTNNRVEVQTLINGL